MSATHPTEPLAQLAQLAWDSAPQLCHAEHHCQAYHRTWPMIRFLIKKAALPAGHDFFAAQLATFADRDQARIFISGGADTGVLAMAHQICAGFKNPPKFYFLDRCETTVMLNRTFAKVFQLDLETQTTDLLDCHFQHVDAVLAHSFLVFFPKYIRPQVVSTWFDALRPGGLALTAVTIGRRPNGPHAGVMSPSELGPLVTELDAAARDAGISEADRQELLQEATAFWTVKRTHDPLTEAEVIDLFEQAGFHIETVQIQDRKQGEGPRDRPDNSPAKRQRMFVAARKPF